MNARTALAYLNPARWPEYLTDRRFAIKWAVGDALTPDGPVREAAVRTSLAVLHPGRHRLYRDVYNEVTARKAP